MAAYTVTFKFGSVVLTSHKEEEHKEHIYTSIDGTFTLSSTLTKYMLEDNFPTLEDALEEARRRIIED